jgi:hypothetical protein
MAETYLTTQDGFDAQVAYLQNALNTTNPDLDTSVGSIIYETLIRPMAVLFADHAQSMSDYSEAFGISQLQDSTATEDATADAIASNYNIVRQQGTYGYGTAAIETSLDTLTIRAGTVFSGGSAELTTDKIYVGYAGEDIPDSTDDVEYVAATATTSGYVFAITVRTVDYTDTIVPTNTALTANPEPAGVSDIYIISPVSGGSGVETNAEMFARRTEALVPAIMSGTLSIGKALKASGYNIDSYNCVGSGDAEMLRDKNNATVITTGGLVDVYVQTASMPEIFETTWTAYLVEGSVSQYVCTHPSPAGVYEVTGLVLSDGTIISEFTTAFGSSDSAEAYTGVRFSASQTVAVTFTAAGFTASSLSCIITAKRQPYISELQEYAEDAAIKNPAQSLLVKAAVPVTVDMSFTIGLESGATYDEDALKQYIATWVNSLGVGYGSINFSDLAKSIADNFTGHVAKMPVRLTGSLTDMDAEQLVWYSDNGVLEIPADLDNGITDRICVWVCDPDNDLEIIT